jgi:transposase
MHQNGLGFREIERLTGISHNTIINWVRQTGLSCDDSGVNKTKECAKPDETGEYLRSFSCCQSAAVM